MPVAQGTSMSPIAYISISEPKLQRAVSRAKVESTPVPPVSKSHSTRAGKICAGLTTLLCKRVDSGLGLGGENGQTSTSTKMCQ